MNQIQKFFRAQKLPTAIALAILFCSGSSQITFAQNEFRPLSNSGYSTDFGKWTPPNTQHSQLTQTLPQASYGNPVVQSNFNAPISTSFPETAQPFSTGVQTADFESPLKDSVSSFEANIDSAASTIGKWKDMAGEKASSLLSGISSEGNWLEKAKSIIGASDASKVIGSLALVLGIYFFFVWIMRKFNPLGNSGLPTEVLEVMGQVPFGPKRNLQMVRLGPKLLLLLNSPEGTQSIGEITDPHEVEHLASLCQSKSTPRLTRPRPLPRIAPQPEPQRLVDNSIPDLSQQVGSTNLNDVIRLLQQASKHQNNTMFEA